MAANIKTRLHPMNEMGIAEAHASGKFSEPEAPPRIYTVYPNEKGGWSVAEKIPDSMLLPLPTWTYRRSFKGGQEVARVIGAKPKDQILRDIEPHLR